MIHAPENLAGYLPDTLAIGSVVVFLGIFLRKNLFEKNIIFVFFLNIVLMTAAYFLFGKSFYALFISSFIATVCFITIEKKLSLITHYTQFWSASTLFALAFLKLGCFAEGCCWGRFTTLPWAVYYKSSHYMPYLYVPVHPVQIYESILAFIAGCLFFTKKITNAKQSIALLLVTLSSIRLFTGFFRGDSANFNQTISILLIIFGLGIYFYEKLAVKRDKILAWAVCFTCLFILSGCILPDVVKQNDFQSVTILANGVEKYVNKNPKIKRNLLFIFGDEVFSADLNNDIQKYYDQNTKLEDLVWWEHAPLLEEIYDVMYKIPQDKLGHQNIIDTIKTLENAGEDYDIVILTHGYPYYLTTGKNYFFSKDEFALLPPLHHLNLVYMQACYSSTLLKYWMQAGAKNAIGFKGENENIYWFYYFLRWYRFYLNDLPKAINSNNALYRWKIEHDELFSRGLEELGWDVHDYLNQVEDPIIISINK